MADLPIAAIAARMLDRGRALATEAEAREPGPRVAFASAQTRRWARAAERRELVRRLSGEGKRVAEIAEAAGISYGYVVDLRREMGLGRIR